MLWAGRALAGAARYPLTVYGPLGVVAFALLAISLFKLVRARQRHIVLDAMRGEMTMNEGGTARRVIPLQDIGGIRLQPIGRGFQCVIELVTKGGEGVELLTTGKPEVAKAFAAGLSTRFGFKPLPASVVPEPPPTRR
jgi:hypothetical protein